MTENTVFIEENVSDNALNELISRAFNTLDRETPSDEGADYKPFYYGFFNGISLIIENTTTYEQTIEALKHLQCKAEDYFIEQTE